MAERTTELRQEIEETREHMGDTLDAIGDRVSPSRIVERRTNRAKQSIDDLRERVMGAVPSKPNLDARGSASSAVTAVGDSVRSAPDAVTRSAQGNPLIAGGLAFGLGVLVASLLPPTDTESSLAEGVIEPLKAEATDLGKQVGGVVKESATQAGEDVKQQVSESAAAVKDEAATTAREVKESASDAAAEVQATAQDSKAKVSDQT